MDKETLKQRLKQQMIEMKETSRSLEMSRRVTQKLEKELYNRRRAVEATNLKLTEMTKR